MAGGDFADFAASYAPDTQMSGAERKAQTAKFDREAAIRIATDAWRKANAALPQGPMQISIDLARTADDFTRNLMGGVAAQLPG